LDNASSVGSRLASGAIMAARGSGTALDDGRERLRCR
jgi:hypothetical protein